MKSLNKNNIPFHFCIIYFTDVANAPQASSFYNYIKLSFRVGFTNPIPAIIADLLEKKSWVVSNSAQALTTAKSQLPTIKLRSGIIGIERSLHEKQKAADKSISIAFQDLDKLMTMAKDMVRLSGTISTKIKVLSPVIKAFYFEQMTIFLLWNVNTLFQEKQGDITEDETVRFKSYLLSLGIDDPVTRDSYKSDSQYFRSLAKQICEFLLSHVEDMGGMMALTDVFCRVNRARSLELLSPEDILNACKIMELSDLPLKLYQFSSGVMVLQLSTLDTESVAEATALLVSKKIWIV